MIPQISTPIQENPDFLKIRTLIAKIHELLVEAQFELPELYTCINSVESKQLELELN